MNDSVWLSDTSYNDIKTSQHTGFTTVNMIKSDRLCNENDYELEKQREQEVLHETSCYTKALLIVSSSFKFIEAFVKIYMENNLCACI